MGISQQLTGQLLCKKGEVVGIWVQTGQERQPPSVFSWDCCCPLKAREVLGFDIVTQSEKIRERVGYMSQKFSLYQELTVAENLSFYAGVYGIRDRGRLNQVLDLVELTGHEHTQVRDLSVGWRQRLLWQQLSFIVPTYILR